MGKTVRTRFAPSPTGRMHVGNLRTALYAYLIAKHEGGQFLLRIEDTDQEREMEGAVDIIYRTLASTGLIHDEGPDKDGGVGPYVQSERQAQGIYLEYAKKLIDKGEAYYCFCDEERLATLHTTVNGKEIFHYDKHCLHLSKEEVEAKLAAGVPYVIRQNNPVVDDHLMGITHVVRGNEYLSSSPKYNRLYDAFGWEVPVYVHCPLITNEEHKKLSKRSGHASYEDLIDQGFLTESVINFVALLGWSPEDNNEFFTLDELVKEFDYHHMSKTPAVFDMTKLRWMNGEYLKKMDFDKFYEMALPHMKEVVSRNVNFEKLASMIKTRIEIWADIKDQIDFIEQVPDYDINMYVHKKNKTNLENSLEVLKEVQPLLEKQEDYSNDALFELLGQYAKDKEKKVGFVMWPIRVALSGKQMTPGGATELMEVLGKEESLARIQTAIDRLSQEA